MSPVYREGGPMANTLVEPLRGIFSRMTARLYLDDSSLLRFEARVVAVTAHGQHPGTPPSSPRPSRRSSLRLNRTRARRVRPRAPPRDSMTSAASSTAVRSSALSAAPLLALATLLAACGGNDGPTLVRGLVKVGDRNVEIQSGGAAPGTSPTVVFEAGEGDDLGVWYKVAPLVAAQSPVLLYTRAGYGQSTAVAGTRDGAAIVAELRATLAAMSVRLPVIYVAHGNSSAYAELWAKTAPAEVAGLVLVEPRHRDFDAQCVAQQQQDCDVTGVEVEALSEPRRSEQRALPATWDALRKLGDLGALPLRVLTGTGQRSELQQWQRLWLSFHQQLAKESTKGKWEAAGNSGHLVQITEPQAIATAVAEVIAAM